MKVKKRRTPVNLDFAQDAPRGHEARAYVREEKLSELFEAPVKAITLDEKTADWLAVREGSEMRWSFRRSV